MSVNPNFIPLNETSALLVRAAADVFICGWDQPGLEIFCDAERVFKDEPGQKLARLVAKGDLYLSVPASIAVRIEHANGDAVITGLTGRLEIQKVGGDLSIEKCAQVDLAAAGGDLLARKITGPFNVQRVGGDFNGETLSGGLAVESVGGDAILQVQSGSVRLRAGGSIKLGLTQNSPDEVVVKAGGDVEILVGEDIGARLELSSGGRDICIEVAGHKSSIEEPAYYATLGDGSRTIRARAGGDLELSDKAWDEDDLSDPIAEQLMEWEKRKHRLDCHRGDWGGVEERVRTRAEEAARRAEERVREAMERVERQNRRREDLFSRFGFNFNFGPTPAPPAPPVSPAVPATPAAPAAPAAPEPLVPFAPLTPFGQPLVQDAAPAVQAAQVSPESVQNVMAESSVSNDERMLVLKMLQEHKITIEEAEQLLSSLDGNFD